MKVTNNPLFEETLNNKKNLLNSVSTLNANVFTPKNKDNFRNQIESGTIKTRNNLARASEQLRQKRFNAQIESSRVAAEEKLRLIRESEQAQEKAERNKKNENERKKDELKQKYENTVNEITTNINARGELKRLFNTFYTKNTIPNMNTFIHEERQRLEILSNQEKALPLVNTLKNLRNFLNKNPNYTNNKAISQKFYKIAHSITSAPRFMITEKNQKKKLNALSGSLISAKTKNNVKTAINKYLGST
jgi:hypothetical protein